MSCKSAVIHICTGKSNYGLNLLIILMFFTIYGVEKRSVTAAGEKDIVTCCLEMWFVVMVSATFSIKRRPRNTFEPILNFCYDGFDTEVGSVTLNSI